MEERMQKNSWLRKIWTLAVAGVMAVVGAGSAWGQSYTIQYKNGSRQTNIPERLDTVYIPDDESRELYVPELRNNDGINDTNYQWYVRWYRAGANGDPINISGKFVTTNVDYTSFTEAEITQEGGTVDPKNYSAALHTATGGTSLFWYKEFYNPDDKYSSAATGASTISYTRSAGDNEDIVICDVSMNADYSPTGSLSDGSTLTEPTLSKRYKFVIRPASEIADRIKKANGKGIEHYEISCPADAEGINIQMKTFPSNYCWYNNGNTNDIRSTNYFRYTIDTDGDGDVDKEDDLAEDKQVIQIGKILDGKVTTRTVVNVYPGGTDTPLLATFTLIPQTNAAFKLEADVEASTDPRRKPDEYPDLYDPIGSADFDMNKAIPRSSLSASNNLYDKPMGAELTTYAFFEPNKTIRANQTYSPLQNQYGLYRSANVSNVSEDDGKAGKDYFWFFLYHGHYSADLYAYDRTYANTNGQECGYFFYTDASNEPGRLVKLELDNVICQYTELTVTAWVNDMTTWEEKKDVGRPLPPNININFIGKTSDDKEIVLHRFTSGDALTDYTGTYYNSSDKKNYPANNNVGKWQQLCYTFSISSDQTGYVKYYLEVQNNTAHTYGADYAIDDVRVYKSKPNIKVNRENNCDASTLIVGTDHATILRNMGWKPGDEVASESDGDFYTDPDYKKYRYGLMGDNDQYRNSHVGNVYFAFLSKDKSTWMTVNNAATGLSVNAAKSLRVAVPTELSTEAYEFYTTSKDDALENEQKMNIRAVEDYNKDYEEVWSKIDGHSGGPIDVIEVGEPGTNTFKEAKYQEAIVELFANRLKIPRLRCPWYEDGILKLAIIDVDNTDLKYRGEVLDDKGTTAEGVYWVVTFSAEQVAKSGGDIDDGTTIVKDGVCTLMSEFTVEPATTVLIDAVSPGAPGYTVCMETMHQITAYLNFYDKETGDAIEDNDPAIANLNYIFDWYLGPMGDKEEEGSYKWITAQYGFSIKNALDAYRKSNNDILGDISDTDLENWDLSKVPGDLGWSQEQLTKMKVLLKQLLADQKLLLGKAANEPFDMPINTERMVAMPYLPKTTVENIDYDFCSTETEVNLEAVAPDNPKIYQGFLKVEYNDYADVALRLGQPNMDETELKLPIYKVMGMADEATHLGLALDREEGITSIGITLDVPGYPTVGKATELNIPKQQDGELSTQAMLKFSLNATAKANMKEGQFYTLLIPFVQFKGETQLNSECDGVLHLPIKVVPEYLTWRGAATDKWYDDDKWYQSTKGELHLGAPAGDDANGSDDVEDAFSPLYFTNITILGTDTLDAANRELQLESIGAEDEEGTLDIDDNIKIKYDLAVANSEGKITPYYIYNVDEVYFKPGATLLNQHLLTYTKAHVEFTMKVGKDYWMASPLQDVYAGDMYAPKVGGKQYTPAFEKIEYNETSQNDRWDMPFYQKAWNKAVSYSNNADGTNVTNVDAVQSNWNIEYNDVWVPYTIGKGFYARVEERDALVRLPKDDASYGYETKALSSPGRRTNAGQLAELNKADGSMTLDLLTKVDNDGNHFLVGNPYMAYLKMGGDDGFLAVNKDVLAQKYWTIDNRKVIVGTPDVVGTTGEWPNEQKIGYVAPMQAFFVESKDYNPGSGTTKADGEVTEAKKVTFNASMTVAAATAKGQETKSFSAVNPVLTLTATSKQGQSRAAVVQKSDASNQYEADKDAVALLDSELDAPMAYTVAGSYAAAVNAIHDYKNVPLGVYAKDGEEVELSIEGVSQLVSPLYLYDAVTRSTTPIDGDSFTLNLTGSSHGRYFLTTDEGIKAEGDIRIYSPADGQLIIASTPSDRLKQVQVYDLNGRMVESRQNVGTAICQLYVAGGIYIVRVQSEQGEAQAKLKIK